MAHPRRSHLAHLLIGLAACSAADPSTPGDVQGVFMLDPSVLVCHGQNCIHENVLAATVAGGKVFVAHDQGSSGTSGPTGWVVDRLDFDGGVQQLAQQGGQGIPAAQITVDGPAVDVLTTSELLEVPATGSGGPPNVTSLSGSGVNALVGLLFDDTPARAAIFGAYDIPQGGCMNSVCTDSNPDDTGWNVPAQAPQGQLYRVPIPPSGNPPSISTTFLVTYSRHLLVADASSIFWMAGPAPGQIMSAGKSDLSNPGPIAQVATGIASGLSLSPSGSVLAWSSTGDLLNAPQAPVCTVWVRGVSLPVFTTNAFFCMGLAIDESFAYFAIPELGQGTDNNSDGGTQSFTYVKTPRVGRIALAGPQTQQAKIIDLTSSRYYGARRMVIDPSDPNDVYGFDPSFVLRIAKSAFDAAP